MERRFSLGILIVGVVGFSLQGMVTPTWASTPTGAYGLSWSTIAGGGATFATAGSYALGVTIGQPATGPMTGGNYTVNSGFWAITSSAGSLTFTDDPLMTGTTLVKAVHVTELRQAIEALRTRFALGSVAWTDASPVAGITLAKAVHLTELRTALDAVFTAAGQIPPTYTHPTITGGATVISAVDIAELRAAILVLW